MSATLLLPQLTLSPPRNYPVEVSPFRKSLTSVPTISAPDLNDLMDRIVLGSEQAFGQFYDELSPLIYGLILRVIRDPAISEEVTQEVFVELWKSAPKYDRSKGKVRSWATTIAHRRAVDRIRSVESSRRRDNAEAETADLVSPSPEATVEQSFEGERVRRELEKLTNPQREAITLAYYQGMTYREVAAALNLPEGTVKTRIRDGMIRLRDNLGENGDG